MPACYASWTVYCVSRGELDKVYIKVDMGERGKTLKISFKRIEVESRSQGSRPRTQKNPRPRTALPRTDHLKAKDIGASVLHKEKRFSKFFLTRSPKNKVYKKIFQAIYKILKICKIVLSSSRGQGNF